MILSHKFRFVFIKGRKVGGTSVEMALSTICGPDDIVTPITPIDELERLAMGGQAQNYSESSEAELDYIANLKRTPKQELANIRLPEARYYNHMPFRDLVALHGERLSGYDVICAERSPYSKILSWANAKVSFKKYLTGGKLETDLPSLLRSVNQVMESGEFVIAKNIDLYKDADGRVVARAMRYDRLLDDVRVFVRKLGLAEFPSVPHAKRGSMSDRLNPREFFSEQQLKRINEVFSEEFSTFGYVPLG